MKIHPHRSWIRRHPFIFVLLMIPCLILCLGIAVPHIRDYQASFATTPQELAVAVGLYGHDTSVDGAMNDVVTIKETLPTQTGNSIYRSDVEEDCFRFQSAFWQRYPGMKELDVYIFGPAVNNTTGDNATMLFGDCTMTHTNGVNQPWSKIEYSGTWLIYDKKELTSIIAN